MSSEISVAETKRQFSDLLNRVHLGREVFVITRRGRRVARLSPVDQGDSDCTEAAAPRRGLLAALGAWDGYEDVDEFLESVRRQRDQAIDREVPELP